MDQEVKKQIESILESNSIILFMKGSPTFPQCGFSAKAIAMLQELGAQFSHVDILESDQLRQGIKEFSNWPTVPQLYVNKELVGGSDIMLEMFESGELKKLVTQ